MSTDLDYDPRDALLVSDAEPTPLKVVSNNSNTMEPASSASASAAARHPRFYLHPAWRVNWHSSLIGGRAIECKAETNGVPTPGTVVLQEEVTML